MKKIIVTFILLTVLGNGIVEATEEPCPKVTDETIYGIWEAIYQKDGIRVFRLELIKDGMSVLSQGLSYGVSFSSSLKTMEIDNGNVTMKFKDSLKPVDYIYDGIEYTTTGEILIRGSGRVCKNNQNEHGVLNVQLIMEPNAPLPTLWDLRFVKCVDKTLVERINNMSDVAKKSAATFRNQSKE